jgi:tRNA G18 (ribose-2'-O)-methylase SpoU
VIPVTSLDDPRLADYRLLADPAALMRRGLFVAEGRLVVRRLLGLRRFRIRSILVTAPAAAALDDALQAEVAVYVVDQPLMNAVTGFNMHRGCLAIAERPVVPALPDGLSNQMRRVLVLEGVNNPDNIGGLFRSAAAFAFDLVVLGPRCNDPLYRKAIRTSMAATLQVPFVDAGAWPDALHTLRASGFHVVALTPASDARELSECRTGERPVALLAGAEGEGLTREAMSAASERLRIATADAVDSLNITSAVSIALYHFRSQGPA